MVGSVAVGSWFAAMAGRSKQFNLEVFIMSMTTDYLLSLPKDKQDAILGVTPEDAGVDPDYEAARDAYESEHHAS
jgi:hypothetical protein